MIHFVCMSDNAGTTMVLSRTRDNEEVSSYVFLWFTLSDSAGTTMLLSRTGDVEEVSSHVFLWFTLSVWLIVQGQQWYYLALEMSKRLVVMSCYDSLCCLSDSTGTTMLVSRTRDNEEVSSHVFLWNTLSVWLIVQGQQCCPLALKMSKRLVVMSSYDLLRLFVW